MSAPTAAEAGEAVPYAHLTPETILAAIESAGLACDGRLLALNSYENRVYQVGIEDATPMVAKFYRPGRWSTPAIEEEHAFALELAAQEIPVVAPWADARGRSLFVHAGYRFALFPRRGGRAPDLDRTGHREWIGRFLGRIHALGRTRPFAHRPALDIASFGDEPVAWLLGHDAIPATRRDAYRAVVTTLLDAVRAVADAIGPLATLRIHGDCHAGNILWTDEGPHFVDLDDCRSGPAVQDLWMLLDGSHARADLEDLLEGYEQFAEFDRREIRWIESLRALRMIHYAAWLARRWSDPAFPAAFPWFGTERYWDDHIAHLREQSARVQDTSAWAWVA